MTNLVLSQFGGMMPRYGVQTLQPTSASFVENALLLSGELRGIHSQQRVIDLRDVPYPIARAYRAQYSEGGAEWITFPDETVDMVKGPLVNDAFDRYYITSEVDAPRMNTLPRLANGDPSYLLGVPVPFNAPIVSPDGSGDANTDVTRAYVYTFVSVYGEEGAPSEAGIATGKDDDVWVITNLSTTVPDASERNITTKNIYRTITAAGGGVAYHYVDTIPLAQDSYNDSLSTDFVGSNSVLNSFNHEPPPPDLIGIVTHPNGFFAGFTGRDIYFSKPYLPHAWPVEYVLSTTDPIKGLGVFGSSIVVVTDGFPFLATGARPDGITFTKAHTAEPCLSGRRGIVSMPFGVYYPSDDGLFLIGPGGFQLATSVLITKQEWQRDFSPWSLRAVRWQNQYVGFYDFENGLMFDPSEPNAALVRLGGVWSHSVIQQDPFSGAVWQIRDNIVYEWNPAFGVPTTYTWVSKEFVTPKPVNFGACKFEAGLIGLPPEGGIPPPSGTPIPPETGEDAVAFNNYRIQFPLNPLNFGALGVVRKTTTLPGFVPPVPVLPETSQPFHKGPLFRLGEVVAPSASFHTEEHSEPPQALTLPIELHFRMYADGQLVYSQQILDEGVYRLPHGYKGKRYQFEFIGTMALKSFKIAETGMELKQL